ncbi:phosphatidylserine/phosphatidylglycerophosphate/cardiolipin synthase-like enzyme [Rhizobium sp. PP-F2F-G48]|uniref:phospholipase D-like domain-containing protein n=1 Tax=Rhizobium sp. PP-F2F-G48 TaxID=2135651 RepID=UPI00104EFF2C|nr:phospholipase D-like domain-containing protein [Rhizobium sp. PP-F2F-G48]TCM52193.1 phosphatidylserine/phosphatidylglycerophosphate/cardiolipin synthase-like enzyme [Rhizobium sp. PP-F2F-G48]
MQTILAEGETCWRTARADRLSVIVDAEAFFRHARTAMMKAKRSIVLIGWDFDTRIDLVPGKSTDGSPDKLGRFFNWLAKRNDALNIRILKWDMGLFASLVRGETPVYMLGWLFSDRVSLKLDSAHPAMSAHHMKLLVIDDAVAFCGGIDMTVGRWDTTDHIEKDKRRRSPLGFPQDPWHDATTCFSGEAAAALAELARSRWQEATGETLEPVESGSDAWPDDLAVGFRDIDLGIARTLPQYDERQQVVEIETATLAIIAAAQKTLYIESQYFASRRIAEALAKRLAEPDGPEIVVINPEGANGWLEAQVMDSARIRLMKLVRDADGFDRFRILYPVNDAGTPIYVHAKIMIADDRILKLGSANLNNRSMGYDTECDVLIEAPENRPETAQTILACRNALIGEHLGRTEHAVAAAITEHGSLIKAIERLTAETGRRLVPVVMRELTTAEELMAESDIADPERPAGVKYKTAKFLKRRFRRS